MYERNVQWHARNTHHLSTVFKIIFQVQFQDGKVCMAIKELYKTLKDHKNPFMQELLTASYQYSFREEYESLKGMSPLSSQELEDCGRENVVRVTLIDPSFQQALTKALEKMIEAKLQIDKFGFNSSNTTKTTVETF